MMKSKQIKQALAARDLALQLVTFGNYSDDRMRIEHKPGPPHEISVWWTGFKVLSVVWHDGRAVVASYRGGPWEWWLKRKAAI
jgi:hypothetical protein